MTDEVTAENNPTMRITRVALEAGKLLREPEDFAHDCVRRYLTARRYGNEWGTDEEVKRLANAVHQKEVRDRLRGGTYGAGGGLDEEKFVAGGDVDLPARLHEARDLMLYRLGEIETTRVQRLDILLSGNVEGWEVEVSFLHHAQRYRDLELLATLVQNLDDVLYLGSLDPEIGQFVADKSGIRPRK